MPELTNKTSLYCRNCGFSGENGAFFAPRCPDCGQNLYFWVNEYSFAHYAKMLENDLKIAINDLKLPKLLRSEDIRRLTGVIHVSVNRILEEMGVEKRKSPAFSVEFINGKIYIIILHFAHPEPMALLRKIGGKFRHEMDKYEDGYGN